MNESEKMVQVSVTIQFTMHAYDFHCDRDFIERMARHMAAPLADDAEVTVESSASE